MRICETTNTKTQARYKNLVTIGYGLPLVAPIPVVQTAIVAINIQQFHTCVQGVYLATLSDTDDKCLHTHFLLEFLDLAAWTSLFMLAMVDNNKTVARVKSA